MLRQPSWSVCALNLVPRPLVIICSSLRRRRSCGELREGLPAVRLQAKSSVTQSPVAVSSSISPSLSFLFNSLRLSHCLAPPLLLSALVPRNKSTANSPHMSSLKKIRKSSGFYFIGFTHLLRLLLELREWCSSRSRQWKWRYGREWLSVTALISAAILQFISVPNLGKTYCQLCLTTLLTCNTI